MYMYTYVHTYTYERLAPCGAGKTIIINNNDNANNSKYDNNA